MTDDPPETLTLRRPDVATTIGELAALKGEAVEIIEARAQVLETLRVAAIRATHPEDWLLFKAPDEQGGQIVGYLQDCGCDRVRDLFGIEVYDITRPEKIMGADPGEFFYVLRGNGRCKITRQTVEEMEGGRPSTDDFCKDKEGAELELAVRKAARANLDGNITRELAGMKSVPVEELARAWDGTAKKVEQCRRGRGFGTKAERLGVAPNLKPPTCGVCGTVAKFITNKDGRGFYGCPNFRNHQDQKWSIDAEKWKAQHAEGLADLLDKKPVTHAMGRDAKVAAKEHAEKLADRPCSICSVPKSQHTTQDHDWDDPGGSMA